MRHARLYSFVGGVIAGISLSSIVTHAWYSAVFVCLTFVSTGVVLFFVVRHWQNIFIKNSVLVVLFFACIFGMFVGSVRTIFWEYFNHAGALEELVDKKVSLSGVVIEEPQVSDSSTKIIAEVSSDVSDSIKVLLTADRYSTVAYGDEIKISGKVLKPKAIQGSEGDFAYDVYLARQGIFYTITFPNIKIVSHHRANILREYLIGIKNNLLSKINELFPAPNSGLLAGLLVSGRSSLSKTEQTLFTQAGLIHIVALSGFNVTIIAQGLMALLIFLPKKLRLIIGALGIIGFVVMTGLGATVVRAGIMALLVIVAALVYRTYNVGRALFLAVLFMALWNPMVVFDVSFQLSCTATFAVIFAVPFFISKYSVWIKFLPEQFKIRETILGTAVIEIFLLPILLSTSGQISLVTVITNLLILPILPVVMGFGFASALVGYVHNLLALPFVAISNLMLEYIFLITNFFANIPFGVVSFRIPTWLVCVMYLGLAFWLYRLQKTQTQKDSALTEINVERLNNFFLSHSNLDFQKKP